MDIVGVSMKMDNYGKMFNVGDEQMYEIFEISVNCTLLLLESESLLRRYNPYYSNIAKSLKNSNKDVFVELKTLKKRIKGYACSILKDSISEIDLMLHISYSIHVLISDFIVNDIEIKSDEKVFNTKN